MSDLTKDVPKGTLTKEETIVYLIEVDNRFLIEPSVMRNAIYSACHYLDEESAKEPQEEPNIPLECVDGSCPIALSEEYEEYGMDIVHNCEECPYQPQVQPINTDSIIKQIEEQTSFLKDCTKYGNKDSEQQHKSYSTMMMYEVADLVDDLIEIVRRNGEKEV